LLDSETLSAAEVKDRDILRLQPEITAGANDPETAKARRSRRSARRIIQI
jgi:hypothetical protein